MGGQLVERRPACARTHNRKGISARHSQLRRDKGKWKCGGLAALAGTDHRQDMSFFSSGMGPNAFSIHSIAPNTKHPVAGYRSVPGVVRCAFVDRFCPRTSPSSGGSWDNTSPSRAQVMCRVTKRSPGRLLPSDVTHALGSSSEVKRPPRNDSLPLTRRAALIAAR